MICKKISNIVDINKLGNLVGNSGENKYLLEDLTLNWNEVNNVLSDFGENFVN